MENPYEAPDIADSGKPRGAQLLAVVFFLLAAFCMFRGIGDFVVASLFKAGFFPNTILRTPLWKVAVESGIVLLVAALGIVTGLAFRRGRYQFAVVFACVTLLSFAYTVYWL